MSVMLSHVELLRTRTSVKYCAYPSDVLPMFVAEMDCTLAPPVQDALLSAIRRSDTGYVHHRLELPTAFAEFASACWDWDVDPGLVRTTTDVSAGIVETLRRTTSPGDGVVIMPPVYPPFWDFIAEAGCFPIEVPLTAVANQPATGTEWHIDLDGVRDALADGARAVLLCNPHNPLGLVHSHATLARLADLAVEYDATVISDEIHAPLTHSSAKFIPFLATSEHARTVGVTCTSASKGWNLAGTKCALMVGASNRAAKWFQEMPEHVFDRTSALGYTASVAAFRDGRTWLSELVSELESNKRLLLSLLQIHLPSVPLPNPEASFLAWLNLAAANFGPNPTEALIESAKLALTDGAPFGAASAGFGRINFACSVETLELGVKKLATGRLGGSEALRVPDAEQHMET